MFLLNGVLCIPSSGRIHLMTGSPSWNTDANVPETATVIFI